MGRINIKTAPSKTIYWGSSDFCLFLLISLFIVPFKIPKHRLHKKLQFREVPFYATVARVWITFWEYIENYSWLFCISTFLKENSTTESLLWMGKFVRWGVTWEKAKYVNSDFRRRRTKPRRRKWYET